MELDAWCLIPHDTKGIMYIYIVGFVWIYFVCFLGGLSGGFTNFISFIYKTLRQSLSQFTL